jgi:hypothetical protein
VWQFGWPSIPMPPFTMPPVTKARKPPEEGRDYDDIEYGLEGKGTVVPRPPSAGSGSLFDFWTFGLMLGGVARGAVEFRTGWFVDGVSARARRART